MLLSSNSRHDRVVALLRDEQPDVVLLQEFTRAWRRGLAPVHDIYPHRHAFTREDNFGIALFSRHPLESVETRFFGTAEVGCTVFTPSSPSVGMEVRSSTLVSKKRSPSWRLPLFR